jgi:hypothetical protein
LTSEGVVKLECHGSDKSVQLDSSSLNPISINSPH